MDTRIIVREKSTGWLAFALFLLSAAGLVAVLQKPVAVPSAAAVLAQREGCVLLRGAPPLQGKPTVLSRAQLIQGTLMLASPAHPLPSDLPAPDTPSIRRLVGAYLPAQDGAALRREAIYALCALQTEYALAGKATLLNGMVSNAQQEEERREAFFRYARVASPEEALTRAREAVPGGGESEHQTGWAIDIALTGVLSMGPRDPLLRNEGGKWLQKNLWRFGFIRRYTQAGEEGGCEHIHVRYVGPAHSAAIHALNGTLEDYLALLRREKALTLRREGQRDMYLYCMPGEGDITVSLPPGAAFTCSADNTGWTVIALEEGSALTAR